MFTPATPSAPSLLEWIATRCRWLRPAPAGPTEQAGPARLTPPPPVPAGTGPAAGDVLVERLREQGADLVPVGQDPARALASLGWMIGEHRRTIAPLLEAVLNQPAGQVLRLDLRQQPAPAISLWCQFAQSLTQLGLLADYEYRRAPHFQLTAAVRACPEGRRFLASGWFPHYGRAAVLRRLGRPYPPHALGVRLVLPAGEAVDLDVVAWAGERLIGVRFGCAALPPALAALRRLGTALPALSPWASLVLPRIKPEDVSQLGECYEVTVCDRQSLPLLLAALPAGAPAA